MFNTLREAIKTEKTQDVLRREELEAISEDSDMDIETAEIAAGFRLEALDNTMGLAEESEFDEMDGIEDEILGDVGMDVEDVQVDDDEVPTGSDKDLIGDTDEGMEEVAEEIPGEGDEGGVEGLDVEGMDVSDLMDLID